MLDYLNRPTEIFYPAYQGNTEELKKSLEIQYNLKLINHPINSQGGHTVLFVACYGFAKHDTVELLITKGAESLIRDNIGRSPVHIAANTGNYEILKFFLDIPSVLEQIWQPISNGQTLLHMLFYPECGAGSNIDGTKQIEKCLELLLKYEPDLTSIFHQQDKKGLSPLMIARYFNVQFNVQKFNLPDFSEIILPENIDEILDTDFYGRTPLMKAAFDQNLAIVRQCIDKGYDCDLKNIQSGRNPLHLACHKENANLEIIGLLIDNMKDPMCGDDGAGRTPLHIAAFVGRFEVVEKLLQYANICAYINKLDNDGRNCLHALFMSNNDDMDSIKKILNLLLKNNIDCSQKDIYNKDPLIIAQERGFNELVQLIKNPQSQNHEIPVNHKQKSSEYSNERQNFDFFSSSTNNCSNSSTLDSQQLKKI